jgi:retron-type reverse transcriptase
MPRDGIWLLNVIWTKPLPSSRDTDFETVFSSLSFGFPPHAHDGGGDEGR